MLTEDATITAAPKTNGALVTKASFECVFRPHFNLSHPIRYPRAEPSVQRHYRIRCSLASFVLPRRTFRSGACLACGRVRAFSRGSVF